MKGMPPITFEIKGQDGEKTIEECRAYLKAKFEKIREAQDKERNIKS